ncbi:proline dehydrogenase family protein [Streptomyces paradoxus]|uniref:proline dehydrogenase family protein n=1 Tax=Streptomyces paradoxus TaxID=66375 RepID=UPI0036FA4A04
MNSEPSQRVLHEAASRGLRTLAADERCRAAFTASGSVLRGILAPAGYRYVLAADREEFLGRLAALREKSYRTTAEVVGEENFDPVAVEQVVREYLAVLDHDSPPGRLGFDLSNVGLAVSRALARDNTERIVRAAAAKDAEVVLSMERAPAVDAVLGVFHELAARYDNVGVTLQAHLHRSEQDIEALARPGLRVRLVKGAFQEPAEVALGRGPALDARYLRFAERLVDAGVRLSLATQDPVVLAGAEESGLLKRVDELEMLHGVRPALLRRYREAGYPCRIYATYGENWWLHLLHRLAEHPPMVLSALADIGNLAEHTAGSGY